MIHLLGGRPVVGGAGFLLGFRADVGALLDAGDVVGIGAVVIAARKFFLVQLDEDAPSDGFRSQ